MYVLLGTSAERGRKEHDVIKYSVDEKNKTEIYLKTLNPLPVNATTKIKNNNVVLLWIAISTGIR